ncbi:MAG: molybdate ABC transporter substrate-binding protein [Spirulina sp.]
MKIKRRYFLSFVLAFLFAACGSSEMGDREAKSVTLTVSAAASLKDAIAAVGKEYKEQFPNVKLVFNFGSSGSLQHQIEQGAPADVFISAAERNMDALREKDLILEETHKNLLQNQIVLIAPKGYEKLSELQKLNADKFDKIALGDPKSVPAGHYSKEVLDSASLYQKLESKFVFAKDVRQVLSYVETGNVDGGFVYATDAKVCKNCRVIFVASEDSHSPIVYPIAVINGSKNVDSAREFVEFLSTDTAKSVFEEYGFAWVTGEQ